MAKALSITVAKIFEKNKMYNVKDEEGNWYGHGRQKPTFNEGDVIEFEVSMNGKYSNIDVDSVRVLDSAPQRSSAPRSKATEVMSRDDYWARKEAGDTLTQREIRLQASRNAAISLVGTLLQNGVLPLTTKGKDKLEIIEGYVDMYTNQFITAAIGARTRDDSSYGIVTAEDLDMVEGTDGDNGWRND